MSPSFILFSDIALFHFRFSFYIYSVFLVVKLACNLFILYLILLETEQMKDVVEWFLIEHQIPVDKFLDFLNRKKSGKTASEARKGFWRLLASHFPLRPIPSLYYHLYAIYDISEIEGKWSKEEESHLRNLVAQFGRDWKHISGVLARKPSNCRIKYSQLEIIDGLPETDFYVNDKGEKVKPFWHPEAEILLLSFILNDFRAIHIPRESQTYESITSQTISWDEIKTVIKKHFSFWLALHFRFNHVMPKAPKTNSSLAAKWGCHQRGICRLLKFPKSKPPRDPITYEKLYRLIKNFGFRRWTLEDDILFLERYVNPLLPYRFIFVFHFFSIILIK
jgi:hypothetical protein